MSQVFNPSLGRRGPRPSRAGQSAIVRVGTARLSTTIYAVVTVVLVAAGFTYHRQTSWELQSALVKRQVEASRLEALTIQTERVAAEIQKIKTDPRMIEMMARDLGLIRPGDVVIKILDPAQRASHNSTSVNPEAGGR